MRGVGLGLLLVLAAGCDDGEVLSGPPGDGFKLQKDASVRDASAPGDAGVADARDTPDAGAAPDAAGRDAAAQDAAGPACDCPQPRPACSPPPADSPVFSRTSQDMSAQLADLIACATSTLAIASYEVDWDCFPALVQAQLTAQPSLQVQVVVDDDQCPRVNGTLSCSLGLLEGHPRVRIVDDMRSRYMHHKVVIADGARAWVGSANLSFNSFCSEHNNALIVDEPAIVQGYQAELARMFVARDFGPVAPRPAISGGRYALYFSPETPVSEPSTWFRQLVAAVGTASTSVDFLIFALTRAEVSEALIAARDRGVAVRGVVDSSYLSDPAVVLLKDAGLSLRVAQVHDKLMIIDGRRVITGSPNWSANSWANDEASLWIDDPGIAQLYTRELDTVFATALPP